MYSDEVEESLNEELIEIMMQDQLSTEKVKLITIAPQPPLENEMFHTRNHLQQPAGEYLTPKPSVSRRGTNNNGTYGSGVSIKIEQEGSKETEKRELESIKTEDGKETDKSTMGDRTKKSGSMSSLEATSFQKRLFGLHQSAAHKRKNHTLPLPSKATGSSSSSETSDLRLLSDSEPPLSPATIMDSPYPPPEPMELQYFEVN